jgi:hypothetical protein
MQFAKLLKGNVKVFCKIEERMLGKDKQGREITKREMQTWYNRKSNRNLNYKEDRTVWRMKISTI